MDILCIIFLIFGWIFKIKGLVITALVLAVIVWIYDIFRRHKEKETKVSLDLIISASVVGLSIVKLCIL